MKNSVYRGGDAFSRGVWSRGSVPAPGGSGPGGPGPRGLPAPGEPAGDPPMTATAADSTHLTGMHSCLRKYIYKSSSHNVLFHSKTF